MITHTLIAQSLNFRQQAQTQQVPYANTSFGTAVGNLLVALMGLALLTVLIFLVTGAFEWITSGGEKGKVESARNKIMNAIIGLIVLAAVLVILMIVQSFLGIHFITFGGTSQFVPPAAPSTP